MLLTYADLPKFGHEMAVVFAVALQMDPLPWRLQRGWIYHWSRTYDATSSQGYDSNDSQV
jgi:hypothetical protein